MTGRFGLIHVYAPGVGAGIVVAEALGQTTAGRCTHNFAVGVYGLVDCWCCCLPVGQQVIAAAAGAPNIATLQFALCNSTLNMRWVVFTLHFPPARNPRAFRMEQRVRDLEQEGSVVVVCAPAPGSMRGWIENVWRTGPRVGEMPGLRNRLRTVKPLYALHTLLWPDDKTLHQVWFLFAYLLRIRRSDDRILTVSNPFSAHFIGLCLKGIFGHRWVADIGDLQEPSLSSKLTFVRKLNAWLESIVLRTCDEVVVNAGSMKEHLVARYGIPAEKVRVAANGCRLTFVREKTSPGKTWRLAYFGNSYPGIREGRQELHALAGLQRLLPEGTLHMRFYGRQHRALEHEIDAMGDWVDRGICDSDEELVEAYAQTDLLVNLANLHYPGIPSKLDEYIACGTPIVHFCYARNDAPGCYLRERRAVFFEYLLGVNRPEDLADFMKALRGEAVSTP